MMKSDKLRVIVVLFLMLTLVQVLYLQYRVGEFVAHAETLHRPTAFATGTARLCINNQPEVNNTCSPIMYWDYLYNCTVDGLDADTGQTLTFSSTFLTVPELFNITSTGLMEYVPSEPEQGNHTIRIFVYDGSGCSNQVNFADYNLEILHLNHPPYLIALIPNRTLDRYTSFTFYLDDYFKDPDNDTLNYTLIDIDTANVTITMGNDSYVNVRADECGQAFFAFLAEDPYGATNTSNTVVYTMTGCPASDSGGSGGGGGGGSSGYLSDCIPEWKCGRYSSCMPNGTSELRCVDIKGCNPRDYIRYFYKNCTYVPPTYTCQEEWNCTEWSTCVGDKHTRTCLDANSCGTNHTKPAEVEACTPIPSCFNGVKDGDEKGIDCGGSCGACPKIEHPITVERRTINPAILIASILTLLLIGVLLFTFRDHISKLLDKLRYRKPAKPVYLNDTQKKKLIQMQYLMQQRLEEGKYLALKTQIPLFIKEYFRELLGLEHIDRETLMKKSHLLNNKNLEPLLLDFYGAYHKYKEEKDHIKLQSMLDEMLASVFLVSTLTDKDALVMDKERIYEGKTSLDECYSMISNLYIAMEFDERIVAKNLYTQLLEKYESLDPRQKKEIYMPLMRIYNMLDYMLQY